MPAFVTYAAGAVGQPIIAAAATTAINFLFAFFTNTVVGSNALTDNNGNALTDQSGNILTTG